MNPFYKEDIIPNLTTDTHRVLIVKGKLHAIPYHFMKHIDPNKHSYRQDILGYSDVIVCGSKGTIYKLRYTDKSLVDEHWLLCYMRSIYRHQKNKSRTYDFALMYGASVDRIKELMKEPTHTKEEYERLMLGEWTNSDTKPKARAMNLSYGRQYGKSMAQSMREEMRSMSDIADAMSYLAQGMKVTPNHDGRGVTTRPLHPDSVELVQSHSKGTIGNFRHIDKALSVEEIQHMSYNFTLDEPFNEQPEKETAMLSSNLLVILEGDFKVVQCKFKNDDGKLGYKDYSYICRINDVEVDDQVLVEAPNNILKVVTVVGVTDADALNDTNVIRYKEIISKVDLAPHTRRQAELKIKLKRLEKAQAATQAAAAKAKLIEEVGEDNVKAVMAEVTDKDIEDFLGEE